MPRNLYNRVELLTPVEDEANRAELSDVLDRAFADNTNAWELGSDGVWSRLTTNGDPPRNLTASPSPWRSPASSWSERLRHHP